MKVLQGELIESRYTSLEDYAQPIKETFVKAGMTGYIDNTIGVHKVEARDQQSVSLHIYSPPKYKGLTPETYRIRQEQE